MTDIFFHKQSSYAINRLNIFLVSFTSVVARACETVNFRIGCSEQRVNGADIDVCYCNTDLCNDSTHVTSSIVAFVLALATIGVLNMFK